MYKNLIQVPVKIPVYITAITDAGVALMLARSQINEGSGIIKIGEKESSQPQGVIIEIETSANNTKIKISASEAREILVRSCDICWHCGECMVAT